MPIQLKTIQTQREKYHAQVAKEISKLKAGYGISISEMSEKLGLSSSQFRLYKFTKNFTTVKINREIYFTK